MIALPTSGKSFFQSRRADGVFCAGWAKWMEWDQILSLQRPVCFNIRSSRVLGDCHHAANCIHRKQHQWVSLSRRLDFPLEACSYQFCNPGSFVRFLIAMFVTQFFTSEEHKFLCFYSYCKYCWENLEWNPLPMLIWPHAGIQIVAGISAKVISSAYDIKSVFQQLPAASSAVYHAIVI